MDCNSSIGVRGNPNCKIVGKHGKQRLNNSGKRLRTFLAPNNLTAASTHFQKWKYGTWWSDLTKSWHQIDHIFIQQTDLKRVKDCSCTQQLVDSDHRAVKLSLRIKVKLKRNVRGHCVKTYLTFKVILMKQKVSELTSARREQRADRSSCEC